MSTGQMTVLLQLQALQSLAESGELSAGQVWQTAGSKRIMFAIPATCDMPGATNRLDKCVAWMLRNRKLGRAEFFAECKHANNSARVHNASIKCLAKAGHIIKERGLWIWK